MRAPVIHKFREDHMATFFEVRIAHENSAYAKQAAQAAFQIASKLDKLLNRYRENSEISQIRALKPGENLRINPLTFECLKLAFEIDALTGGAFSPSLGKQVDFNRENRGNKANPIPPLPLAKNSIIFDADSLSVSTENENTELDLGAIGKGFALDTMAAELKNWDIARALIIAGESSILAMDSPASHVPGWEISLSKSIELHLHHASISSSGRSVKGSHIIDPLTGEPAAGPYRTWAIHPRTAVSDALSTAWMLLSPKEIQEFCAVLPSTRAFLQSEANSEPIEIGTMVL